MEYDKETVFTKAFSFICNIIPAIIVLVAILGIAWLLFNFGYESMNMPCTNMYPQSVVQGKLIIPTALALLVILPCLLILKYYGIQDEQKKP